MTAQALILITLAAVLHASWNLLTKRAAKAGTFFVFTYRVWSVIFYLPWVIYIANQGVSWSLLTVFLLFLSTVLHLLYSLALMWGYQSGDLSVVYPVARGTGPLIASFIAIVFWGEPLTIGKAAGILAIALGIFTIASGGEWRIFANRSMWPGIKWGLIIGTVIAAYSLSDAYAVKIALIAPVLLDWVTSLGGAVMLAPRVWATKSNYKNTMKGLWWPAAIVGLASPMAYILVLYALQLGAHVSQVAPLREVSMVVATIMGAIILKESVGKARWIGCITTLAGVLFIALTS